MSDHEKKGLMRSAFRRNSSVDHGKQYIEAHMMPIIFNQLGQSIDEARLYQYIDEIDSDHTGNLDFDRFTKVCDKFLTNPASMAKFKGDEFTFKNLINLNDFADA